MERHRFGPTRREVAVIGQGTWYIEDDDRASAVAALRLGLDLGMTHIDTAEMYRSGAAEEMVAEAIAGRRDEVFLVSKVLPQNASRSGTLAACEAIARSPPDRPAGLLPPALARASTRWRTRSRPSSSLLQEGKILSWGVSNFDVPDLEEVWEIAGAGPAASATRSSTTCKSARSSTPCFPGVRSTASPWSPTARSVTGTFRDRTRGAAACCSEIAAAHHATARQVALRFLVRRPSLFAIPKASSPEHATENAGAGDLRLTEAELARIDAAFPLGPRPRELPML